MKIERPKWGTNKRPERVVFQAPAGTRETLKRLTAELTTVDGKSTQVSDTVNAILSANRDYARISATVQKGRYDTSESTDN